MEERRTNKQGLGLALSVRKEKFFWHFCVSVVIARVYPSEIPTQLPGMLTHPLTLPNPASGSTSPNSSFSCCLSHRRLSPTVANSFLLLTALRPCLSSSYGLVGNLEPKHIVWVSHQGRQKNPDWCSSTPTPTETNTHHRATFVYFPTSIIKICRIIS